MIDQISMSETLLDAAKEVFETMIFMSITEKEDQEAAIVGNAYLGTISFKGDIAGCLGVTFEEAAAKAVAANMLCLEPDEAVSEADLADAVGEVANMVMGGVKSRLLGEIGSIELSIPTVISGRTLKSNVGDCTSRIVKRVHVDAFEGELSFLARSNG